MQKIKRTTEFHSSNLKNWYKKGCKYSYSDHDPEIVKQKVKTLIRESLKSMQGGFCAYTERFVENGTIDHFDPAQKKIDGFDFNNLFLADSEVNNRRSEQFGVPKYLIPDSPSYSPESYLIFDLSDYDYHARPDLDDEMQAIIENEIKILGINLVSDIRKRRIVITLERLEADSYNFDIDKIKSEEFITAYKLNTNGV